MVELILIDATSGDLVTMAWAGQAHGQGDHLVDVASDRALEGALLRAFALHSFVALTPAPASASSSASSPAPAPALAAEPPQPPESAQAEPLHEAEAVEADAQAEPDVADEVSIAHDSLAELDADHEPDDDDETYDAVEPADDDVVDEAEEEEEVEEAEEDSADEPDDEVEDAPVIMNDADDADDVEDDADDVEEEEAVEQESVEQDLADEDEVEDVPADDLADEPEASAPVGFSQDPLWNEYYEAMLDSLEGLDGQEGFFKRLAQLRGVEHVHWLSPEQLQLELNALDEFGYEEDYLLNPVRDLFVGGEQFMDALQRATSGQAALEFRALYLERMDAGLLTDVEERKLQAMVKKLNAMNPDARAEYIETVLAEER